MPPLGLSATWPTKWVCISWDRSVSEWLYRRKAVMKSAIAPPGMRPSPKDHIETLAVAVMPQILRPARITVLDDVITRGATLLACIILLREEFPVAEVRGFAVARTKSIEPFENVVEPVEDGTITLSQDGWLDREP